MGLAAICLDGGEHEQRFGLVATAPRASRHLCGFVRATQRSLGFAPPSSHLSEPEQRFDRARSITELAPNAQGPPIRVFGRVELVGREIGIAQP